MSLSNIPFVKTLQAIKIIIIFVMLNLEAEFFMGGSCWRIGDNIANGSCVEKERQALLKMKEAFADDHGRLSSWGTSPDCCQWSGVLCNSHTGLVEQLDLHGDLELEQPLRGEISPLLMEFQNLNYLNLSHNDFDGSEIPKFVGSLTRLKYLDFSFSSFEGKIPIELGKLSDLLVLNLSNNNLIGIIPFHLVNLSSLQELHLSWNHLVGNIPYQLGNLSRLEILSIGMNYDLKMDGMEWLSNLRSLTSLDLSDVYNLNYSNNLLPTVGKLPNLRMLRLENCSLTDINILSTPPTHLNFSASLLTLNLRENRLTSSLFPWLFNLSTNLATLYLCCNYLSGPIPVFGNNMNSLVALELFSNELNGTISDVHFHNLTKLQYLDLSYNDLTLKFNDHWIPPFQLQSLRLSYCKLGPGFPRWLRTQNNLQILEVYDAEINDSIPEWFWRLVQRANTLEIKSSNITGAIPDLPIEFAIQYVSLASNQIEGSVPPFLLKSAFLDISGNRISKFVLPCDEGKGEIVEELVAINISSNNLSGELFDCWDHFKSLRVLDLSNNQLLGRIPNSMGSLSQLEQLILRNNYLSGELPSMENATQLGMLDLEKNDLSGPIPPSWSRDNLKELQTLSLRINKLDGNLPFHLCYFTKLRVMDISFNKFTGPIPSCLDKLIAMAEKHARNDSTGLIKFPFKNKLWAGRYFYWYLPMVWKGREQLYNDRYGLLSIDLSHNQLVGEMPTEIGRLVELRFLNLSTNKLSGKVISEIGQLKSLEALDLSRNHFDGKIPLSLAEIPSLSILDVSNNNLSGEIPVGIQLQSFEAFRYQGNTYLCGRPLDKLCSSEDHPLGNGTKADDQVDDEDDSFMKGFFESLGVGFAVGFWIVFGSLLIVRSWRHAFFHFLNNLGDSIYVATVLHLARRCRWLRN